MFSYLHVWSQNLTAMYAFQRMKFYANIYANINISFQIYFKAIAHEKIFYS